MLFILFYLFFNFCYSVTVVCIFSSSLHPTPANPTSLPHLYPPPWFCPCVLYSSSCKPLSPLSPPHSPLAIVRLFLSSMSLVIFCLLFLKRFYLFIFRERGWEEKGREPQSVASHMCPNWGPSPQPRHVLWLGIKPVTFRFVGWCSTHWAIPDRTLTFLFFIYLFSFIFMFYSHFPPLIPRHPL